MTEEQWRPIAVGYQVSDQGRVIGLRGRVLKPRVHSNGYLRVSVVIDGKVRDEYVHRLVARAFHGEPIAPRLEVDHVNGRRDDNRAGNLRWLTVAENRALRKKLVGEAAPGAKLSNDQRREIIARAIHPARDRDLAKRFGVSRETIRDIRLGKKWSPT